MAKKKLARHRLRKILFVGAGIVALIIILAYNLLPFILKSAVSGLAEKSGYKHISLDVKTVNLSETAISNIVIGILPVPAFSIASIRVGYSLYGLISDKKMDSLEISGAEINCSFNGKSLLFPDFDPSAFTTTETSRKQESTPFMISSVSVRDSLLKINYKEKLFIVPFSLQFTPGKSWQEGYGEISFFFREQPVKLSISLSGNTAKLSVVVKGLNLQALYGFLPEGSQLSGSLSLNLKAEAQLPELELKNLDALLELENLKYSANGSETSLHSAIISAKGSGNSFIICSEELRLIQNSGAPVVISSLKLPISVNDKIISGVTGFKVSLPLFNSINELPLNLNFIFNTVDSSFKLHLSSKEFKLLLPNGEAFLNGIQSDFELLKTEAKYDGCARLAIEEIKLPSSNITLKSISSELPMDFSFNNVTADRIGKLSIEDISCKNFNIGEITGTLKNSEAGISFNALAPNALFPGLATHIKGSFGKNKSGLFSGEVGFSIPKYTLAIPYNLGTWFPQAEGVFYDGSFEADGLIKFAHYGIESRANLHISDSNIELKLKESSARAEGAFLDLCLTDLINMRSKPSQTLKIKNFKYGTLLFEDIYALFHIEDLRSVLFEAAGAKWCDGIVALQAIRIDPSVKKYPLIISCSNVNLAQLLGQFNIGKAEGEGSLNGTIPLYVKDDSFKFGNGFLYSTPGNSGTIRIEGGAIDSITDGVPDGTPQFDQLKLSQMALKDFDYDWVKLYMNSEGDNMLLKLQFDGKPAKPLPFVFKKEYGGFARVDINSPGSVFQGIRLDVNINLPFNKLLWYNKQMQKHLIQQ